MHQALRRSPPHRFPVPGAFRQRYLESVSGKQKVTQRRHARVHLDFVRIQIERTRRCVQGFHVAGQQTNCRGGKMVRLDFEKGNSALACPEQGVAKLVGSEEAPSDDN